MNLPITDMETFVHSFNHQMSTNEEIVYTLT